jgi:capsular polysaccharide transport system permease protein
MIHEPPNRTGRAVGRRLQLGRVRSRLPRFGALALALLASAGAALYWSTFASDRYVSSAHIIVQRSDLSGGQGMDFSSLLSGAGSGSGRADQLLLREHLRSGDMLRKLDEALKLKAHFSDPGHDFISRLWDSEAPLERFQRHFLNRVSVEFDDYSGVLVLDAQAYDPATARSIAAMMVKEGERFMNAMARDLAQEQVGFLEEQVTDTRGRAARARQMLLDFQNRSGLASPQATAENIGAIVARLEGQRSDLQTQLAAQQSYLVPTHPTVVQLNQQIAAVERQIAQEQGKLVSASARTLNRAVEEYQRLELDAGFAQEVYKTALVALEKGRVEATRTLKKVSVLQAPALPEYPLEPRRMYNTLVFAVLALLLAGVAHLLAAIVRDHKD